MNPGIHFSPDLVDGRPRFRYDKFERIMVPYEYEQKWRADNEETVGLSDDPHAAFCSRAC